MKRVRNKFIMLFETSSHLFASQPIVSCCGFTDICMHVTFLDYPDCGAAAQCRGCCARNIMHFWTMGGVAFRVAIVATFSETAMWRMVGLDTATCAIFVGEKLNS